MKPIVFALSVLIGCNSISSENEYLAPELFPTETLAATVGVSVRTAASYTGTTYLNCDGAADYVLGDSTVEADAGDADAIDGITVLEPANQYIAIFSAAGTKNCDISHMLQDSITAPNGSSVEMTPTYTGDMQLVCGRQHHLTVETSPATATTSDMYSVAAQIDRVPMNNQRLAIWCIQTSCLCGILGVK